MLSIVLLSAMAGTQFAAPEPGEPWLLRWLRAGREHPLLSGLACLCLTLACAGRPGAPSRDEPRGPEGAG